jgi:hypothetical protein
VLSESSATALLPSALAGKPHNPLRPLCRPPTRNEKEEGKQKQSEAEANATTPLHRPGARIAAGMCCLKCILHIELLHIELLYIAYCMRARVGRSGWVISQASCTKYWPPLERLAPWLGQGGSWDGLGVLRGVQLDHWAAGFGGR